MFDTAHKTTTISPSARQKTAGNTFFRKAGDDHFFGNKESTPFFKTPVQAKLTVSTPDDPQEKEADAVAEKVMRMEEPVVGGAAAGKKEENIQSKEEEGTVQAKPGQPVLRLIQRKENTGESCQPKLSSRHGSSLYHSDILRQSGRGPPASSVPFEQSLASSKGGGSALPGDTQQFMESRFQADFSGVRIHTGSTAESLSQSIHAQAFAHGNDIYFNSGKFSPNSTEGRSLLAHELTHTIQQGASKTADRKPSRVHDVERTTLNTTHGEKNPIQACSCARPRPVRVQVNRSAQHYDDVLQANAASELKKTQAPEKVRLQPALNAGTAPAKTPVRPGDLLQTRNTEQIEVRSNENEHTPDEEHVPVSRGYTIQKKAPINFINRKGSVCTHCAAGFLIENKIDRSSSTGISETSSNEFAGSTRERGPPAKQGSLVMPGNIVQCSSDGSNDQPQDLQENPSLHVLANSSANHNQVTQNVQRDEEPGSPPEEESFFDKLKNGFDATLQLVLPDAVYSFYTKLKNGGILNYIKTALVDLLKGLFWKLGFSDAEIQVIFQIFVTLKTQLPAIIIGLVKGDCKPLFEALNLLSEVVGAIAGRVWDNLMAELEPVRLWLIEIWNTFGAPVIDEITAFAGEQWNQLKALGSFIWDSFRPIREKGEEVWNWVVDKLGFGSSDEPGFLGYITNKLTEAWESIKTELKPVIEPVNQVIEGIQSLASLEAIKTLQEDAKKWLDEVVKTASAMGSDEDAVANKQVTLRQVLLPALNQSIDRLKAVLLSAGAWIVEKVGVVANSVNGFLSGIQGNSYLAPVYPLIKWIPTTIDNLRDWATDKVTGLFTMLQQGAEHLKAFFSPILTLLEKLVSVAGNLLKYLPDLILGVPYMLLPRCIKDPIIKWLTEVVLKQIPIISEFISLTEKWEDIKAAALTVLKQVFVDGQLAKALWTYFKMLLTILGIDPQLVVKVIAKAAQNFSSIISKPGAFLKNIWSAIKGGFSLFFENILIHLPKGALDWLFGEVKGATKVAPPKDFSVGSILGFVLDLFGITKDNVYERMSQNPRIGPKKVEQIRKIEKTLTGVLEWISVWIKEGPEGLLRKIKKEIGDLKTMVINGIVSWISTRIVAEITKKLVTSADPLGIGATLNTIKLVYDTLKTAVAYINRMLNLVNSVMDSVADIISGNTKGAAVYLESVLAKAVPFVVGFAVEVIIGPIGDKIKEIVGGARKKIDAGIDFLINGALDFIGTMVDTAKGIAEGVKKLLGLDKPFTAVDSSSHHLFYASVGGKEQLMVASATISIDNLLKNLATPVKASTDAGIQAAYTSADQRNGKIKTYEGQLAALPATPSPARQLAYDNLSKEMEKMTKDLEKLMVITAGPKPPDAILPAFVGGVKAGGFEALYISASTTGGETADKNNGSTLPGWNALLAHKDPADPSKTIRERDNFVKMHLLHDGLGGKASDSNLTPMKSSYNTNFYGDVERHALADKPTKVLWYNVQIVYHPSAGSGPTVVPGIDYSVYPSRFIGKYGYMEFDAAINQWKKANAGNPVKAYGSPQVLIPDFSGGAREYDMNTIGDTTIASMTDGVNTMPPSYANIIELERREAHDTGRHRKYASYPDLTRRLDARQAIRAASGYAVGRAILDYLKTQKKLKFN